MYENPVTIKEDPDTGLLLLVDGNGKTLARASTPGDLVQLGASKGVYSGDLPPAVDPRGSPQQAAETQNKASNQTSAAGQTAEAKVANDTPPATAGAGQGNNNPTPTAEDASRTPLTSDQVQKLETNQAKAEEASATAPAKDQTPPSSEALTTEQTNKSIIATITKNGGNTNSSSTAAPSAQVNQTVPSAKLYNVLHDYTAYTYRITLYLLTPDDLTALSNSPETFVPTYALISSGGGFANKSAAKVPGRHPDFMEDFYFDNLSLTTVVGLNSKSKASNAIDIKFNIVEPYGMTLLDRLFSACQTSAKCTNYVEVPYLIQIDFLSNVDEVNKGGIRGNIIDSKRIPLKITEFKIKPTTGGTVYSVRGMPYNHVGFLQSVGATPVNLSVTAKTVGEYFSNTEQLASSFDKDAAANEERIETAVANYGANDPGNITQEDIERYRASLRADLSYAYNTKSYTVGYNTYFKNIAYRNNLYTLPQYQLAFNIADEISKSNIIDPQKLSSDKSSMADRTDSLKKTAVSGAADPNFKQQSTTNILAGTSVLNVIDRVMAASDYIKNQVQEAKAQDEKAEQQTETNTQDDARATSDTNKTKKTIDYSPTNWYKIIPSVILGDYDEKSKAFSKQVVYSILPYKAVNAYHPSFKYTKISASQCVRTYNYFYTGLNQDIISLDIDFDATFITGVTTYMNQAARGGNDSTSSETSVNDKQVSDTRPPLWLPFSTKPTPVDTGYSGSKASRTEKDISVASISRSLYSAYPRGDMLNIKMKIAGDPSFIKQDDIYYNPLQDNYGNFATHTTGKNGIQIPVNPAGQIIFDDGQVFVQLIVKGSVDIDDATGIVNKKVTLSNGQTADGSFSGVYRVMTVESIFDRGKFEQLIDLIRMPDDLADTQPSSTKTTDGTNTASVTQQAANEQIAPAGGTPFNNPRPENVPATDTTLKSIGNGPVTNPSSSSAGNGVPTTSSQPTNASASNVNDASNSSSMPQEKAPDPNATEASANAKAAELTKQYDTVYADFKAYLADWNTRYDVYRNASETERNTEANLQARLDLQKEFLAKNKDVGVNGFGGILKEEMAIQPKTGAVGVLANKLANVLEVIYNNQKTTQSSIDKITEKLNNLK